MRFSSDSYLGSGFTLSDSHSIMRLVPLSKRGRVNQDDTILNERLSSDKLVITGIINDINNPSLSGTVFTSPSEVAVVQPEGTSFDVTTSDTNCSNSSYTNLEILNGIIFIKSVERASHMNIVTKLIYKDNPP